MLQSFQVTEPALVQTLHNVDNAPSELTSQEWALLRKVLRVLKPFKEATEMLSRHDASISMVIPIVTMIIEDLETEDSRDDHGVLTMKRALKKGMETRFAAIEKTDHYIVSTLLDSKFKLFFYRDPDALDKAKTILMDQLVEFLRDDRHDSEVRQKYFT